ncbi:MAG: SurA N-terminal domain-containing protein [Succinivibrio sp.]|nr:SurA N-terminal domain-containing protein [Succinivibrio sp.]
MLTDTLREGAQGKVFKILFFLIILSFIFAGVGNYLIPRLNTDPAKVGDFSITYTNWNEQVNQRTQNLQRNYGPQAVEMLENKEFVTALRMNVLESMIDNVALNSAAYDAGIRIGDEQIKAEIRNTKAFHKDGKFNNDLYLAVIRNSGMSPEYYAEQLRVEQLARAVVDPVFSASGLAFEPEIEELSKLFAEQRKVKLFVADTEALEKQSSITDDEVQAYYKAHPAEFKTPASVDFSYLHLTVAELKKNVKYTDAQLEEYYNLHQDEFMHPEQREATEIFIKQGENLASETEKLKADLKSGEDFDKLVRKYHSKDTPHQDGKLGLVSKSMLSQNAGTALFALQKTGDISEVVLDETGAHVFKLQRIVEARVPEFASIKNEVIEKYTNTEARNAFAKEVNTLSDLTFENPDSLEVAAKALNLEIKEVKGLVFGDTEQADPLNNPEVQKTAFNESNRTSGNNTNVVTLGDDAACVMNVSKYTEAKVRAFEEVKAEAHTACLKAKVAAAGEKLLSSYQQGLKSDPQLAAPELVQEAGEFALERGSQELPHEFVLSVFALPQGQNGKVGCLGSYQDKPALAVLTEVGLDEQISLDDYGQMVKMQLMQYKMQTAQQMLFKSAREISKVEYNEEAIKAANSQQSTAD